MKLTLKDIIFIAAIAVLLFLLHCSDGKRKLNETMMDAARDSLTTSIDSEGRMTAEIANFEIEKASDLLKMQSSDSTIIWLQGVVKETKGKLQAALVAATSTTSSGTTQTTVIKGDTIKVGDTIYVYPKYETEWQTKWEEGYILAGRDSIQRRIKINNEYEVTIAKASNGWFKKRVSDVKFKNLNPNTATEELRSVSVTNKQKKFVIVVYGGYGAGYFGLSPQVGIGAGYVLMGIK